MPHPEADRRRRGQLLRVLRTELRPARQQRRPDRLHRAVPVCSLDRLAEPGLDQRRRLLRVPAAAGAVRPRSRFELNLELMAGSQTRPAAYLRTRTRWPWRPRRRRPAPPVAIGGVCRRGVFLAETGGASMTGRAGRGADAWSARSGRRRPGRGIPWRRCSRRIAPWPFSARVPVRRRPLVLLRHCAGGVTL